MNISHARIYVPLIEDTDSVRLFQSRFFIFQSLKVRPRKRVGPFFISTLTAERK